MPCPRPDRPTGTTPRPAPRPPARSRRRAAWLFELVHKLLTGGAALASLLRLLF
jgi:hypothetical protein